MKNFGKSLLVMVKWMLISLVIGLSVGAVTSLFSYLITFSTNLRTAHPLMVLFLPAAGLLIVFLYRASGVSDHGTNTVIEAVRTEEEIPLRIAPLIFLSTILTHLFGGSAGREGAALQFGGSVGSFLARKFRMNESDRIILMMTAMSAAFAALFGTPLAAAVLPMEFVSVGVMYYAALVPCVLAAFVAHSVAVFFHIHNLQRPYAVTNVPSLYSPAFLKIIIFGILCALVGILFCNMLHYFGLYMKKWIANPYLRIAAGGAAVVLLSFLLRSQDYLGMGSPLIQSSLEGNARPEAFLLKMIFTGLTLCCGFKGGEIVPSFVTGATLGCAFSGMLGLPPALCAACGMCGVFCAVTNSPITSILIAFELFGFDGMAFFAVTVAVSYMLSGYCSVFSSQKIVYSKTQAKFIDKVSGSSFTALAGKDFHKKNHDENQDGSHEEDAEHADPHHA